MTDIRLTL